MTNSRKMTEHLFFRLLPIQILLSAVGSVNGIVSSLFASNSIGAEAMTAVGLYAPISMFIGAVSTMLVGGAQILCGKYMGSDQLKETQHVFSLDLILSLFFSLFMSVLAALFGALDLTDFFTKDPVVRPLFNQYLLGQAIGIVPMVLSAQISAFLSLEHQTKRTFAASLVYILVNVLLNFLFLAVFHMGAFGLALASSLGFWVFLLIQLQYYLTEKALLKLKAVPVTGSGIGGIVKIGAPGALTYGYQAVRNLIVNMLILVYVGSMGLSAFTASNTLLGLVWAVPTGFMAVSRMLMSISEGEEDRQTLTDVMRTVLCRCLPLMCAIVAVIVLCAEPLTKLYYQDPAQPVYQMTVNGFRLLPLCMLPAVFVMNFTAYGQISGKQILIHVLSVMDGVVCVSGFSALLIPFLKLDGVYVANILNGFAGVLIFVIYACLKKKHFPRTLDELMVIPEDFGAPPENRLDVSVTRLEEVVRLSEKVQQFCLEKGVDQKRSYLAGLSMEEMAGNVISHGFVKDKKNHTADIRVVYKDGMVILRIKDDCIAFDPAERQSIVDPEDPVKNIGIRMIYAMAKDIRYQNILGLNVLTIKI
ncbi:MAG: ATP-binding protein [Lachnospiraceae bacterium]|nr:ATP-binding protein [Lachnospiraceae bacterium]